MRLSPEQLQGHLGRGLAPVYLVYGDEPLQVRESLDAIRATAKTQGFLERQVFDVERGFDWSSLRAELRRANGLLRLGRAEEARRRLEACLERWPRRAAVHAGLGLACREMDDTACARRAFATCLEIDSQAAPCRAALEALR